MQDDLQDGIEIKIIPGSTLPEDKLYKAERAKEDAEAGLVDIQTYLEQAGGYDNPEEVAKRAIMYKANPFSVVTFNEEDIKKLQQAAQLLAMVTPTAPGKGAVQGTDEQRVMEDQAQKESEIRARVKQLVESEEFKQLPRAEKARVIREIRASLAGSPVEVTSQ